MNDSRVAVDSSSTSRLATSPESPSALRRSKRIQALQMTTESTNSIKNTAFESFDATQPLQNPTTPPILSLGLLADIQYAPIEDGYSYAGNARYYRHALDVARHAARHLQQLRVDAVINLGDIVDGKCKTAIPALSSSVETNSAQNLINNNNNNNSHNNNSNNNDDMTLSSQQAIYDVLQALSAYQCGPVVHTYGNHCLYNMDRPTLQRRLGMPFVAEMELVPETTAATAATTTTTTGQLHSELVGYDASYVQNGIRVIVLDAYDICLLQRDIKRSRKYQQAVQIMQQHNPNYGHGNENSADGLIGLQRRYVAFNGAVGSCQLEWLRTTLQQAREQQERVVIVSHPPLLPGSANPVTLVWNYVQVLDVIRDYRDIVMACLAGHAHRGGYQRCTKTGIHFFVLPAVLESPPPICTYATLQIHDDCLVLNGYGDCDSGVYSLDHMSSTIVTLRKGT